MKSRNSSELDEFIDWICAIQQIPAPTFHEAERAAYMHREFKRLGMQFVENDKVGNVLARLPGGDEKCLVVSAHLDTVHHNLQSLPLERSGARLTGPGVADNSTGLAALLVLAQRLVSAQSHYPGDIYLVANVCEEGLGNLAGMRALVERFSEITRVFLVLEGLGLGQVVHRALGVERLQVTAETAGGHSWVDFGAPSAIHELAKIVAELSDIPLPPHPRSSLNVGVIQGGTSINSIASQAYFLLDLRAEDQKTLLQVSDRVRGVIKSHQKEGVKITIEEIGMRPAGWISVDHPLVRLAGDVLNQLEIHPVPEIGSTDANVPLNFEIPAVCLGLAHGNFPHTAREYIETGSLESGITQIQMMIDRIWSLPLG